MSYETLSAKYKILKDLYSANLQESKSEKEHYERVVEDLKNSIEILLTCYIKEERLAPHFATVRDCDHR